MKVVQGGKLICNSFTWVQKCYNALRMQNWHLQVKDTVWSRHFFKSWNLQRMKMGGGGGGGGGWEVAAFERSNRKKAIWRM